MEIFKNKWFWVTTTIVFIAMLCEFYNCIIYNYPLWVKTQINLINKPDSKVTPLEMGTYGDMYGALNTLFSGLAFSGLLITIGVQIWLHYREQKLKKKEKRDKAKNKLIYLDFLVKQSLSEIETFKAGIDDLIKNNSLEKKKAVFFTEDNTFEYNKVNHIDNKIDQEVFFTAYFHKYNKTKTDIIDLFVSFGKLVKSRQSFIEKLRGYEVECDNELFKLSKDFNILHEKGKEASQWDKDSNNNIRVSKPKTLGMIYLNLYAGEIPDINILGIIGKKGHLFEIYYKIKDEYESELKDGTNLEATEIDEYLENSREYIETIEAIKCKIVELCNDQIIDITNCETDIKKVKIRES